MTEFRHSQIMVRGSSLYVLEAGDADAVPFLFLHGWPESVDSWRAVMSRVAERVSRSCDRPA
jgi:hypothetical protein